MAATKKRKPMKQIKEMPSVCHFCANNKVVLDYKDPQLLRRFVSSYFKIAPRRRSGLCALHQRKLANAIKQARIAGIMPFVSR